MKSLKALLCLCIILFPVLIGEAQTSNQDSDQDIYGCLIYCLRDGGYEAADRCTVRCYKAYGGAFVIAGYTGPDGGHNNHPPYFNRARFADESVLPPGDPIEAGEYALYCFYAKRQDEQGYWWYSDWSPPLLYDNIYRRRDADLELNRPEPPRIEDMILQEPNH
jgi:hypothetical protein